MFNNQHLGSLILFLLFISRASLAQPTNAIQQRLAPMATDSARVTFLEQQIDRLYRLEPERALAYADLADSLLQAKGDLAWQLELRVTKAKILREMGSFREAQEVLQLALATLPESGNSPELSLVRARIHAGLAIIYRRQGDLLASVAQSRQAIRQLDSLVQLNPDQEDYLKYQANAYTGLAITYAHSENYPLSNRYFRHSLAIDQRIDDQKGVDAALFNLGSNFFKTQHYDSAEVYWISVIDRTDTTSDNRMLDAIYRNLGALATQQEQWGDAERHYRQALRRFEQRGNQEGVASIHESLSYMYNQMGEYEAARQQAVMGLEAVDEDLRIKSLLYGDLAEANTELNRYHQAAENYRTYAILRDSLLNQEKAEAMAEMEARYQHEQQEKELAIQRQEIELLNRGSQIQQLERNLLGLVVSLLVITGFFVLRSQRQKVRRKQEQLNSSRALVASIKENAQLKEQKLLQELEHRNQQLTSYTLNFVQKNELMSELRDKVENLQQQKEWTTRDFRRLKMHIQQHVSIDQDWENFRLHFESVHPDFFHNLTEAFPTLGPKELKLCALIRLNMSIKESATVLGISPDSVKTARHRLRKKMSLNQSASMLEVLMQVEKGKVSSELRRAS